MYRTICVTNRHLSERPFVEQVARILRERPAALILREKDMDGESYGRLAESILSMCREAGVPCIFNTFLDEAVRLGADGVHLPYSIFLERREEAAEWKGAAGVSVHSAEEAASARDLGADYLIYGHVFETDCKKGVPPRGLENLRKVCASVDIPVCAIGGINDDNEADCIAAGASAVCRMSSMMKMR